MSLTTTLEQPALDQFIRHAHLFGTECVFETSQTARSGVISRSLGRRLTRVSRTSQKRPDFWLNQAADLAVKRHPRGKPHSGLGQPGNGVWVMSLSVCLGALEGNALESS
jgi:hypothetical protein